MRFDLGLGLLSSQRAGGARGDVEAPDFAPPAERGGDTSRAFRRRSCGLTRLNASAWRVSSSR